MALSVQHFPAVLFLPLTLLLSACDSGDTPADIREVARQGAYSMNFSASGDELLVGSLHHGGSLWSTSPAERLID